MTSRKRLREEALVKEDLPVEKKIKHDVVESNLFKVSGNPLLNILRRLDKASAYAFGRTCKTYKDVLDICQTSSEFVCATAAKRGYLNVLKWARETGCYWDERTCASAAVGGHLDVLKWVINNGCPSDWRTCDGAAVGGHLDVLKWARKKGCPWNELTTLFAAQGGHMEIWTWAITHGCRDSAAEGDPAEIQT